MKTLVLAGGFPQIALIRELKSRGIVVILADYNSEPVAKPYADKYYQISTLDVDAIRSVAVQEKVDFLITACTDQALCTVAKVSEELGLPCYIDYRTALNVTNKQYMKQVFSEHGIPTARHVVAGRLDRELVSSFRFPLVVKPVDCNSSKGVRRCDDYSELASFFEEAVAYSRTNTAVIEEFIEGLEISVDVYVEDGVAHVLCISNSDKIAEKDKFVISRAIWPAPVPSAVESRIAEIAQRIADAFEIRNAPMLIQFLIDGENVSVVEFSARTGGGVKYLLIQRTCGFDVIKAVVDLTLGELPHVGSSGSFEAFEAAPRFMVNDFIYCKPGVFDHLEGFEELKSDGFLLDYYLFKPNGTEFEGVRGSGDRLAGYTISGDAPEELISKHNVVRKRIKAISKRGSDMIRHDLLTDLVAKDGYLFSS